MGELARRRKVPDELANIYEFANSLDCRRSARPSSRDELADTDGLGMWMSDRGLVRPRSRITPRMLATARALRSVIRELAACDPAARRSDQRVRRALNEVMRRFPLVADVSAAGEMRLQPARTDALGGLSILVAELQRAWASGALDRLKMCPAEDCQWVFFDRSKPRSRRWCSSTGCGNRAKTRTYRERHKHDV
jgi:predicted RNA-binding Zn ribbon-like protein